MSDTEERMLIAKAVDAALDAAMAIIQDYVGQDDGGFASQWLTQTKNENTIEEFQEMLKEYLDAEKSFLINDDMEDGAQRYIETLLKKHPGPVPEKAKQILEKFLSKDLKIIDNRSEAQ